MAPKDEQPRGLGALADPRQFTAPVDVGGWDPALLKSHVRTMLLIRRVEEKIGDGIEAGDIACPCHLGIGQEAIAVGVAAHLRSSDRAFGTHRSHPHYIAMGGSVYSLFAEVFGKADGCSSGMGGSMHLQSLQHGFIGSVPIVAATIPVAVGAALAAKKDGRGDIAIAFFGDGATEEGVLHESLNLAAALKLPVLFVCENNLFSSHLHVSLRQPCDRAGRFAESHCMPVELVDGNDVLAVSRAAQSLVSRMREEPYPAFLEAVTYRWRGHVGPSEDIDVGVNRGNDLVLWKERDPIRRLLDGMRERGLIGAGELELMEQTVAEEVSAAWRRAESAPYPDESALLDLVYSNRPK